MDFAKYNSDNIYINEAMVTSNHIAEGYIHPVDDVIFKAQDFPDFLNLLKKNYDLIEYDFSDTKKTIFKQFRCDEFFMFTSGDSKDIFNTIFTKSLEISRDVFNLYRQARSTDTEVKIFMTSYKMIGGQMDGKFKTMSKDGMESISNLYYPYINTDVMYQQFFNLDENILLLAGKPGIGKCLDGDEEIEIFVEDDVYEMLTK